MRVIFLADVPGSGLAGEAKEVKNGYARNFLIPRKLAVVATHDQLQRIEGIRKAGEERRLKEEQDLTALSEHLAQLSVTITANVGPTGRFYGAVTSAQIAEELSRLTEREFDRRTIQLEGPIHEPGEYQAEIRFPHGISATVQVVAEGVGEQGDRVRAQKQEEPQAVSEIQQTQEVQEAQEGQEGLLEQAGQDN